MSDGLASSSQHTMSPVTPQTKLGERGLEHTQNSQGRHYSARSRPMESPFRRPPTSNRQDRTVPASVQTMPPSLAHSLAQALASEYPRGPSFADHPPHSAASAFPATSTMPTWSSSASVPNSPISTRHQNHSHRPKPQPRNSAVNVFMFDGDAKSGGEDDNYASAAMLWSPAQLARNHSKGKGVKRNSGLLGLRLFASSGESSGDESEEHEEERRAELDVAQSPRTASSSTYESLSWTLRDYRRRIRRNANNEFAGHARSQSHHVPTSSNHDGRVEAQALEDPSAEGGSTRLTSSPWSRHARRWSASFSSLGAGTSSAAAHGEADDNSSILPSNSTDMQHHAHQSSSITTKSHYQHLLQSASPYVRAGLHELLDIFNMEAETGNVDTTGEGSLLPTTSAFPRHLRHTPSRMARDKQEEEEGEQSDSSSIHSSCSSSSSSTSRRWWKRRESRASVVTSLERGGGESDDRHKYEDQRCGAEEKEGEKRQEVMPRADLDTQAESSLSPAESNTPTEPANRWVHTRRGSSLERPPFLRHGLHDAEEESLRRTQSARVASSSTSSTNFKGGQREVLLRRAGRRRRYQQVQPQKPLDVEGECASTQRHDGEKRAIVQQLKEGQKTTLACPSKRRVALALVSSAIVVAGISSLEVILHPDTFSLFLIYFFTTQVFLLSLGLISLFAGWRSSMALCSRFIRAHTLAQMIICASALGNLSSTAVYHQQHSQEQQQQQRGAGGRGGEWLAILHLRSLPTSSSSPIPQGRSKGGGGGGTPGDLQNRTTYIIAFLAQAFMPVLLLVGWQFWAGRMLGVYSARAGGRGRRGRGGVGEEKDEDMQEKGLHRQSSLRRSTAEAKKRGASLSRHSSLALHPAPRSTMASHTNSLRRTKRPLLEERQEGSMPLPGGWRFPASLSSSAGASARRRSHDDKTRVQRKSMSVDESMLRMMP